MKTILLLVTCLLVATNWVFADKAPDLDDPKVRENILKEAVSVDSLKRYGPEMLFYQADKQTPYTGWTKGLHRNGEVWLGHFKDGKMEGLRTSWYENGKKSREATFKDGRMEGPFTMWHKNGEKYQEATYKDGKMEGPVTSWRENGKKHQEGTFKDGKHEGVWITWDKEGKVVSKTRYKDGVEIKE